eukprot:CAMPEP_0180316558 /NCGR_PEP_ID=MMETSP0988-20121125/33326_1 /TAXON_ID=697907 /ORGANISM="non described non described, Strain CCMP2293" /LENGTH=244 /DNA_ID=CAMNT_0022301671 /DNA_START=61 /DNA_END=794 /DNA_ORIENTATION=+
MSLSHVPAGRLDRRLELRDERERSVPRLEKILHFVRRLSKLVLLQPREQPALHANLPAVLALHRVQHFGPLAPNIRRACPGGREPPPTPGAASELHVESLLEALEPHPHVRHLLQHLPVQLPRLLPRLLEHARAVAVEEACRLVVVRDVEEYHAALVAVKHVAHRPRAAAPPSESQRKLYSDFEKSRFVVPGYGEEGMSNMQDVYSGLEAGSLAAQGLQRFPGRTLRQASSVVGKEPRETRAWF